jgi:hypothetical protein
VVGFSHPTALFDIFGVAVGPGTGSSQSEFFDGLCGPGRIDAHGCWIVIV